MFSGGLLRPYWAFARAEFNSQRTYIGAALGGAFTQFVFGVVRTFILVAVLEGAGGTAGGYDRGTLIANVWLVQAMMAAIGVYTPSKISERIKEGEVAVDLLKPVQLQLHWLSVAFGKAIFELTFRGIPILAIGSLIFGATYNITPWGLAAGLLALTAAITLSFYLRFMIGILGFWVVETRGLHTLFFAIQTFLSGFMVPVHLFPDWLSRIVWALPFVHIMQTPVDLLTGYAATNTAPTLLATQTAWILATILGSSLLLTLGKRKIEVQGG